MFLNSIQKRVLLTIVVSELLLAVALASIAISYTRHRLLAAFDTMLRARAMSLAALVHYADEEASGLEFDKTLVPPSLEPGNTDLYSVEVTSAGAIARSSNWPSGLEPPKSSEMSRVRVAGKGYRGAWLLNLPILDNDRPTSAPRISVFYAARSNGIERELVQATEFIAACSTVILAVTLVIAYWGLRRGLLPLRTLAQQSANVSTRNWDVDVDVASQPSELKPLIDALNAMLARLRRAFVQQREFLGNAAHELKTPVAVLKSTLQALNLKPRTTAEYRQGLDSALEDLERLEKLVQWMLRLARAEQWTSGSARSNIKVVELTDTCDEAVMRIAGLARQRSVSVEVHKNGPSPVRADPEDLQIIWANLLDNAIRYSPEHARVEMRIARVKDRAQVRVSDHGPGIPEKDVPHVFERFHRGDPSRARQTGGFGLGLALAKAFTEAYGGTIQLDREVRTGTSVVVELPLFSSPSSSP
ncbi:MAG TPA: ATP-binding protein [Terriglobales bacterium]|nr:ATP-binding protein [Terriglobales bacterium]